MSMNTVLYKSQVPVPLIKKKEEHKGVSEHRLAHWRSLDVSNVISGWILAIGLRLAKR